METFDFTLREVDGFPVVDVLGYFNDEAGDLLEKLTVPLLENGRVDLILDFSQCKVINSLGVAALMELALKYVDDYQGKLVFCSLDKFKFQVLNISGVLPLIQVAADVKDAVETLKS